MNNEQVLERGTGRTTRLIKALPKNSLFLVHSQGLCRMVEQYKHEIGRSDITVVSFPRFKQVVGFMEPPAAIGIDHFAIESGCLIDLDFDERRALREINSIYVLDEMSMPTCIEASEIV